MSELSAPMAAAWRTSVVQDFAASELFDRTFQEGMELVEDTAAYLDGAGRQESKLLSRSAALAYAAESMRLTTRLMQLASWLLVQRAVREGDMAAEAACEDRYRLKDDPRRPAAEDMAALPGGLKALIEQADRLFDRTLHLDRRMYVEQAPDQATHPVFNQREQILAAFGG
ncbi:MAG: protease adaptor protein RcdA [Caulobacteraceae bacterium]